jgi:hypothetical protein
MVRVLVLGEGEGKKMTPERDQTGFHPNQIVGALPLFALVLPDIITWFLSPFTISHLPHLSLMKVLKP